MLMMNNIRVVSTSDKSIVDNESEYEHVAGEADPLQLPLATVQNYST